MTSNSLSPGMTISIGKNLYRVESATMVTAPKGSFIKTKLCDLATDKIIERNFKPDQAVKEVSVSEKDLEYLYLEGKEFVFLDIDELEEVKVAFDVVGKKSTFLKEGVQVKATVYGESVFSVELPSFLELAVAKTDPPEIDGGSVSKGDKKAILETGAEVTVPPFIDSGDIIKVDTVTSAFIQRV